MKTDNAKNTNNLSKQNKPVSVKIRRNSKENRAPHDFNVYKAIRAEKHYKSNIKRRDVSIRKYVDENLDNGRRSAILPGQLIMFNYFTPKTADQLEYYDAMPCTIFFGIVHTKNGKRVIGFNLHYYPPRMRYKLMDKIYEIFKSIYSKNYKMPLARAVDSFDYKALIFQLQKAKLDFGIREYIPKLMGNIVPIPVCDWSKAVFTEGHFRKETREQILNYWKNKSLGLEKPKKKV